MTSHVVVARGDVWFARSLLAFAVPLALGWWLLSLVSDGVPWTALVVGAFATVGTWQARREPALERMGGLLIVRQLNREVRVLPRHVGALSLTRPVGVWFLRGSIPDQGEVRLVFTGRQIRDGALLDELFGVRG